MFANIRIKEEVEETDMMDEEDEQTVSSTEYLIPIGLPSKEKTLRGRGRGQNRDRGQSRDQAQSRDRGQSRRQGQSYDQGQSRAQGQSRDRGQSRGQGQSYDQRQDCGQGQNSGRSQSRGQGQSRGRGRCRVRGRRNGVSPSSSQNARYELAARKRVEQQHRILLPDAPPRKRRTKNPSPARGDIEFLPACVKTTVSKLEPEPVWEPVPDVQIEYVIETTNTEPPEDETELHVVCPTPSTSTTVIDNSNTTCTGTVLNLLDNVYGDSDIDDDIDYADAIVLPLRTATDNPAYIYELFPELIATLRVQEENDDRYVQEIASGISRDFNWTGDRQTFTGKREHFTGTPGPTFPVTNDMSPVDIFNIMFNDDFFDILVTETNRYAQQTVTKLKQNPETKQYNRCLSWTPTDRSEMVAFLTFIILQGLYPKVNEESYFAFDGFGTTPYFGRIMTYNRYYQLKMLLHFTDDTKKTHDRTKLYKIQPIVDYFNRQFASLYTPGQEIAIDESLLKWHGRLSFTQKISTKAAQVGVKTYELCESSTGYLWTFRVYTGKDGPNRTQQTQPDQDTEAQPLPDSQAPDDDRRSNDGLEQEQDSRPTNSTSKIVFDLVGPLLHRGHTLIMDNFYNSPLLARCLKQNQTDVFGTMRLTREFVPDSLKTVTKAETRKGEVIASYCSDLAVMLWRDANLVSMISTYHPLQVGTSNKYEKVVYKPAIVLDYNKYMGGVDRKDQYLASHPMERTKNKIWYKKLFRRLYNVAIFNCFVIFSSSRSHKISHRAFRTTLAESLLKIHRQIDLKIEPRLTRPREMTKNNKLTISRPSNRRPYVEGNHFPTKTGTKSTRCWMCARNKASTRTAYKCEECNVNLCIIGCFKEYHKPPGH